jgi:hypothetical protein
MPPTTAPGRLRGNELLAAVAAGTAGAVGEQFLRSLVRHVAEAFAAKMVLVAEASDPSGTHVRVLACHGCLDVDSPPGAGTRVHASIPLAA